jgi:hypothetical protein
VSAFLDVSTITWNVSKLEEFMSLMDVEAVHQIPISHLRQPDFSACHYDKRGIFLSGRLTTLLLETKTRREDYLENPMSASNTDRVEIGWKKLWKVKVPSKLRIFA